MHWPIAFERNTSPPYLRINAYRASRFFLLFIPSRRVVEDKEFGFEMALLQPNYRNLGTFVLFVYVKGIVYVVLYNIARSRGRLGISVRFKYTIN